MLLEGLSILRARPAANGSLAVCVIDAASPGGSAARRPRSIGGRATSGRRTCWILANCERKAALARSGVTPVAHRAGDRAPHRARSTPPARAFDADRGHATAALAQDPAVRRLCRVQPRARRGGAVLPGKLLEDRGRADRGLARQAAAGQHLGRCLVRRVRRRTTAPRSRYPFSRTCSRSTGRPRAVGGQPDPHRAARRAGILRVRSDHRPGQLFRLERHQSRAHRAGDATGHGVCQRGIRRHAGRDRLR